MTTWMNVDAFVSIIQIRPLNKSLDTTLILRSRVDIRAFCLELETVFSLQGMSCRIEGKTFD